MCAAAGQLVTVERASNALRLPRGLRRTIPLRIVHCGVYEDVKVPSAPAF